MAGWLEFSSAFNTAYDYNLLFKVTFCTILFLILTDDYGSANLNDL